MCGIPGRGRSRRADAQDVLTALLALILQVRRPESATFSVTTGITNGTSAGCGALCGREERAETPVIRTRPAGNFVEHGDKLFFLELSFYLIEIFAR